MCLWSSLNRSRDHPRTKAHLFHTREDNVMKTPEVLPEYGIHGYPLVQTPNKKIHVAIQANSY